MKHSAIASAMTLSLAINTASAAQLPWGNPQNSTDNNFTMLQRDGTIVAGGANDVVANWDGTLFNSSSDYDGPVAGNSPDPTATTVSNGSLTSPTLFFSQNWTAHDVQFFAPGTYTFDSSLNGPAGGGANAESGMLTMTVLPGQVGVHMLFDWNGNWNIDVINVYDKGAIFGSGLGAQAELANGDTCGLLGVPAPGSNCIWDVGMMVYTPTTLWDLASSDVDNDGVPGLGMAAGGPFADFNASFNLEGIFINTLPIANNDAAGTTVATAVNIDVAANDTDAEDGSPPPAPPAAINITTPPTNGGIINNGDGTVTYTPNVAFLGVDTFQYTLTDSDGGVSNAATVTVTVTAAANTPPVANNTAVSTNEDTPLNIDVTTVATDADGDSLTYATFDPMSTQGGTVTVDGTNTILTYTPATDFNGADTFTFSVNDGIADSNTATITVTVNPVNDAPACTDVTVNTDIDIPLDIDIANDLLSTCSDVENDPITLNSFTQPVQAGSMVTNTVAATLTYTPALGFSGQDSFTYTATDGTDTDTKTVTVDVGKVFGNFTMLDAGGSTFGGTNDVVATWDGTFNTAVTDTNFNMTMASDASFPFFGFPWIAHDIRVFGPGNYTFDTSCSVAQVQAGLANCGGAPGEFLSLNVGAGQIGAHVLFDWNVTANIDVVLLWDSNGTYTNPDPAGALYLGPTGPTPVTTCVYELVSRDADGDTVPGARMIDGPFIGFRANFNVNFLQNCAAGNVVAPVSTIPNPNTGGCSLSATPADPAKGGAWWLLTGLLAWIGWRRRRT